MSESKSKFNKAGRSPVPDDSTILADDSEHLRATPQSNPAEAHTPKSQARESITDLKDRQLGDFRLLRRLGHGGMAHVYLAEQVSLKRNVAVKVLREEMLSDDVHLRRFEQEAKAAGGLNHPNIVQVYMIGEQDGVHYIAQEYVPGLNLREFLTRSGPPKLTVALNLMKQIAAALEAAAEAGIVHRDVKPENILITRKGNLKVTDFGLAQLSLPGEHLNLTQVGMTMGTPLYMSPEQVNGRKVDHRSDIYSLGVTCYHLLGGSPPFRGETALSVAVQHVNEQPVPLSRQRADLPDVVCRLVHKMMEKNPDERYQSASALVDDLEKILAALKDNPTKLARMRLADSDVAPPSWDWFHRVSHWSLKRQIVTALGLFLLVTGASAAVGYFTRPADPFQAPPAVKKKQIPRKATAFEQWRYAALLVEDEDAWKAVIDNFPESKDREWRRTARLGLAMLYLHQRRLGEAEKIFRDFTVEDDKNEVLKARGYAGLAVIASLRGQHQQSQKIILDDFDPFRDKLDDRQLRRYVEETYRLNNKSLGVGGRKELYPPMNGTP